MHAIVGAADAAGEPLIALLGDHRFYSRFALWSPSGSGSALPILIGAPIFWFGR